MTLDEFKDLQPTDLIYYETDDEIKVYQITQRNFDGSCIAVCTAHITTLFVQHHITTSNCKDWELLQHPKDFVPREKIQ